MPLAAIKQHWLSGWGAVVAAVARRKRRMFLGEYRLGDTLFIPYQAVSTGDAAMDATVVPAFRIYAGSVAGGDADTPVAPGGTGSFVLRDDPGSTGWYTATVTLSAANGFAENEVYTVQAQGTVDGRALAFPYLFYIRPALATADEDECVFTGEEG